ncbi:integrase catalytic domain-containing protein [Trichonephila clavata]|uniref:Integrase catalytic domain-containing protein n=1 Tax=Trichonephila clavata TaxID=2740835 RepID=A0A8X6HP28_TRICU|nr:integrase catalytic domain-containing protein [Trichonephila clavata]
MRRCVQFSLSSVWNKNSALITAFESSNKYTSHPAAPADIVRFAKSQKLILADPPEDSNLPMELLIGGDFYWHVVKTKSSNKVEDSFVMIPSIFGWVLSGSRTHTTITHDPEVHHVSVQISGDRLDNQVRCSWELDSIGIIDTQIKRKTVREKEIMAEFSKTYQTEDNR